MPGEALNEKSDSAGMAAGERDAQSGLAESLLRLIDFQRQALALKKSDSAQTAMDTTETLLLKVVDFSYASLQVRDENETFRAVRDFAPPNFVPDPQLMAWGMGTQEVSVIPAETDSPEGTLHSQVLMPLGQSHIMLLWLRQTPAEFTREQEALLSILASEAGAVLDAHKYRLRLEKSHAATLDIIESVPHGILALDHLSQITMINSTAEIALDVRRRDALGRHYHNSLPKTLSSLLDKMLGKKNSDETEITLQTRGTTQHLGVMASSILCVDDSAESGSVIILRDLELSREVRKLRELDAMKNDFLSLVSHELRTPLTSIMACSETLLLDDMSEFPPEWKEYLATIYNEGKRLSRLIDDILDHAKMEAGKMSYNFEMHDVSEAIGSVVISMIPLAEAKGQALSLDIEPDLEPVRMDLDRFIQVMNNVVSNAVKYTGENGAIVVRARKSDPFDGQTAPTVTVTVEDNGIGIAPENMDKVFAKFEMIGAIKNHASGSGLGLVISKQIVEDGHGGKIWIESGLNEGTKVHIRLPIY